MVCLVRQLGVMVTVAAAAGGLWLAAAQAAPAPWYWWVSKVDEQRVCAQTMPEQGWERAEGPFTRSDCQR